MGAEGQGFHEMRENLVTILTFEGESELGGQESVTHADVVAPALEFGGEVTFTADELGKGGAELDGVDAVGGEFGEEFHHFRGEDVHSEKTEVMTRPQSGDIQMLFGLGGGGFFADLVDQIYAALGPGESSTDGTIIGEFAFVSGLDGGDRAVFGGGDLDKLSGAGFRSVLDIEMVADEQEERGTFGEIAAAQDGMTVPPRRILGDEMQAARQFARAEAIRGFVTGPDHEANLVDPGVQDILSQNAEGGLFDSVAVHESLERERGLSAAGGGNDGFLDFHEGRDLRFAI